MAVIIGENVDCVDARRIALSLTGVAALAYEGRVVRRPPIS
jgi:hypothetical protein